MHAYILRCYTVQHELKKVPKLEILMRPVLGVQMGKFGGWTARLANQIQGFKILDC